MGNKSPLVKCKRKDIVTPLIVSKTAHCCPLCGDSYLSPSYYASHEIVKFDPEGSFNKSDGSTADYYKLPSNVTELQHLISHRNMNAQIGEIFRACYRYGIASHSDQLRDAKKILFYAKAEVERLENLAKR